MALSTAMRDMLPLRQAVKAVAKAVTGDDTVQVVCKSDVWEDNNGALTVATMPKITPQSKFFNVKLHFFKEHVATEQHPDRPVHIHKIDTEEQLADIMTKGLTYEKYQPLRDRLMGWDLDPDAEPTEHPHSGIKESKEFSRTDKSKSRGAQQPPTTDGTTAPQGQTAPSGTAQQTADSKATTKKALKRKLKMETKSRTPP